MTSALFISILYPHVPTRLQNGSQKGNTEARLSQGTQKVGDVKHLVTHNDPAVLVGVVLGNLICADRHTDSSWMRKIRAPNRDNTQLEPKSIRSR